VKRLAHARRLTDGAPFNGKANPAGALWSDSFTLPTQNPPNLPSSPERELVFAVVNSAIHALRMPRFQNTMRRSQEGSLRLNAIAWILGHTREPRFSFDYCCWVMGNDTEAARRALIARYQITEQEIVDAHSPWVWSTYVDSIREYA